MVDFEGLAQRLCACMLTVYIITIFRVVPIRFWRFRFDFLYKELISRELVFDSIYRDSDTDSIRSVSIPTGSKFVSKGFLINFNSIACDSIFDLDSFLNFDSIACGSSCVPIR